LVTKIKTNFLKINISFSNISFLLLMMLLLLNSLRYIFQFNSSGTSPTYSDTPTWFYLIKYSLLLCFVLYMYAYAKVLPKFNFLTITLILFMIFFIIINILNIISYSEYSSDLKIIATFLLVFFSVYFISKPKMMEFQNSLMKSFGYIAILLILMNIIVIINFLLYGRLPALAYAGSLVRFGSFWDDPNGFGMFSSFLFIFFLVQKKYFLSLLTLINIALTVSFSSYAVLAFGMILVSFKIKRVMFFTIFGLILFSFLAYTFYDFLMTIYQLKSGSIEAHAFEVIFGLVPLINGSIMTSESWLITMTSSYFPGSLLFIIVLVSFFFRFIYNRNINFYELYIILFSIGNLFIPYIYTFPNDIIFFIALAISLRNIKNGFKNNETYNRL